MKPDFYMVCMPEPVRVLGVELLPFSLGHAILLQRFGCYPIETPGDLLSCVLICSRPFDEFRETLLNRWFGLRIRIWGLMRGKFDYLEKLKLVNQYVLDGSQGPHINSDQGDEVGVMLPGAPWLAHLKVVLQSELGYSPSEALNMPYGLCLWDYWTHAENKDKAEIVDEDFGLAMQQEADAMHERLIEVTRKN